MSEVLQVTVRIIENIRKRFVMGGFEVALYGKPGQRTYDSKMDGDAQAHLIALSCSKPLKRVQPMVAQAALGENCRIALC